jgi:hypothetical protein
MAAKLSTRYVRLFTCLLIALVLLSIARHSSPAAAQGQQVRLGELRTDWYCLQSGYSAWITNNGGDWACTTTSGTIVMTLTQSELNAACQGFYRNSAAFAIRDRNSTHQALDWSCYVIIPPTPTPRPTFTPIPPTRQVRLGEFQVEWYCNDRQLDVRIINNDTDWACILPTSERIVFVLGQGDFNAICQRTYNNPNAYALRDQNKPQPAYNWSCYVDMAVPPTLTPAPTQTPIVIVRLTRLGEFQVEWYCTERGFGVRVVNNETDWACTQPNTNQISFILSQADFDTICQRTYNDSRAFALRDQYKTQPAYNWSCYSYR